MVVAHTTPRMIVRWLSVADVARRLGLSRWAALEKIKRNAAEMGAQAIEYDNRKGARWRVNADMFEEWARVRGIAC